jgi:hypothetical protein
VLSIILLTLPIFAKGQILNWNLPEHPDPPFATQLRKMPVVVQATCKDHDGTKLLSTGTAFPVVYIFPGPPAIQFQYLVTNRHVAECWDDHAQKREVQSILVRVNLNGAGSAATVLPLHWYFPADESADLAVAPINFNQNVEVLSVSVDSFFTKDLFKTDNVGEGSRILLSGYFYQLPGERRLLPVVRQGILSVIPDEPLLTTAQKRGQLYLADSHVFGGNSGSPVFISTAGFREGKKIQLVDDFQFLGVVSGYYYEDSDLNLQIASTAHGTQRANSGIVMIVPADILKELILSNADLKKMRDQTIAVNSPKQ